VQLGGGRGVLQGLELRNQGVGALVLRAPVVAAAESGEDTWMFTLWSVGFSRPLSVRAADGHTRHKCQQESYDDSCSTHSHQQGLRPPCHVPTCAS
jgi:hypothetical protein